ncbi:MAG: DUF6334 family protein [Pseudolysinimonas sp.]
MNDDLSYVAEEYGDLRAVIASEFDHYWVDTVRFEFEKGYLDITVDPDFDTIIWQARRHSEPTAEHTSSTWVDLLDTRVAWIWTLTNQRGYFDGMQFEFFRDKTTIILQLMAEGSRLRPYVLASFQG